MPWISKGDSYRCDVCRMTFYVVAPTLLPRPDGSIPSPSFASRPVHLGAASHLSGRERTICSNCTPGFKMKVLLGSGTTCRVEIYRDGDAKPTVLSGVLNTDVAAFSAGTADDLTIANFLRTHSYKSPGGEDYKGHSSGALGTRMTAPNPARPYRFRNANPRIQWHSHVGTFSNNIRVVVDYRYLPASNTLQIFISNES